VSQHSTKELILFRALMIKHEIKPLKEDLLAVNLVLDDYIDKSKNMGVIGRVRYAVLDRNKLQCIQSNLTKSRTNFGLMLDLINMKANEQHARNDRTGIERLEAILNKQIKEADARKAEARAREKGDAKLEDILQILQQRLPAASKQNDENVSRSQVLGQLEKELQKVGLSKEMAEAARYNAAQALSEAEVSETIRPSPKSIGEPRETNKISGLSPRVELKSRKSSSADRDCHRVPTPTTPTISAALARAAPTATATRSPPDSSPARIVPTATTARNPPYPTLARIAPTATTGSRLPEITKDYRILCVDSTHGSKWTDNYADRELPLTFHSPRNSCTYVP